MNPIADPDLRDFISALNGAEVRYLLVGGYSVILHGYARSTMDMDLWVERTAENYRRLLNALLEFGMPAFDMTEQNFLRNDAMDVFTFGRPPTCIDVMNKVKGVEFSSAWERAEWRVLDGLQVRLIGLADLRAAKQASGRHKDLDDLEHLPV